MCCGTYFEMLEPIARRHVLFSFSPHVEVALDTPTYPQLDIKLFRWFSHRRPEYTDRESCVCMESTLPKGLPFKKNEYLSKSK